MFSRILLATDGSTHAHVALRYARDLALRHDAEVVVIHAFEPVSTYLGEPWLHRVMACHVAAGRDIADLAARELLEAGVDVEVEVLEGPPADAILRVADVRQCDLILMGSRGRGTLASLASGQCVATRVEPRPYTGNDCQCQGGETQPGHTKPRMANRLDPRWAQLVPGGTFVGLSRVWLLWPTILPVSPGASSTRCPGAAQREMQRQKRLCRPIRLQLLKQY